jgi:hypothetical protein
VIELNTRSISISKNKCKSLDCSCCASIVSINKNASAKVDGRSPGAGRLFGSGVPVGVDTEPGNNTIVVGPDDIRSPCQVTGISHAGCGSGGSQAGVKDRKTINKRSLALRDTSVAVEDETSSGAEVSGPGSIRGCNAEADDLHVEGLGGGGGQPLELSHTISGGVEEVDSSGHSVNASDSCCSDCAGSLVSGYT